MHLVVFTEEPSAEAALIELLPKMIDSTNHTFQILTHGGKDDLLKKLPSKLKGMAQLVKQGYRFIVLLDRDNDDCKKLKQKLERTALEAGLYTKTRKSKDGNFTVVNRIVIEELESWFIGDPQAITLAYPKIKISTFSQSTYRIPDNIKGGTWEALERILIRAGYFKTGLGKIEASRSISKYMKPDVNKSESFKHFMIGIQSFFEREQ